MKGAAPHYRLFAVVNARDSGSANDRSRTVVDHPRRTRSTRRVRRAGHASARIPP